MGCLDDTELPKNTNQQLDDAQETETKCSADSIGEGADTGHPSAGVYREATNGHLSDEVDKEETEGHPSAGVYQGATKTNSRDGEDDEAAGDEEGALPIFSFGVVADIQYADAGDLCAKSDPTRIKRYRESPKKLVTALEHFKSQDPPLVCTLTLGDIIDGQETEPLSLKDFQVVLEVLERFKLPGTPPLYHTIGNHCLNVPREVLLERLGMPAAYYDVALHPGWRLVVLDSMDLSLAWPEGSEKRKKGAAYVEDHPVELEEQMVEWNGGVGEEQMLWLREKLEEAEARGEKVVLALHHPIAPGSAPGNLLAWNYKEMLSVVADHPAVVLVLCGHYHPGGYAAIGGTHFVTFEAILEAPSDSVAHGVVKVFEDYIEIVGSGVVTSRKLEF